MLLKKRNLVLAVGMIWAMTFMSCSRDNVDSEPIPTVCPLENELNYDKLITLSSGIEVAKLGDDYIYLGDILLTEEQLKNLDEKGSMFPEETLTKENKPSYVGDGLPISPIFGVNNLPSQMEAKAVGRHPYQNMFWSMLRYTFSSNLNDYQKQQILEAISYIESQTNARFYNATGQPTIDPNYGFAYPYVEFTSSNVNNSYVGRKGGKQVLNLYNYDRGTIVHEICHALGMFHEQCRADRDHHINVNYGNIISGNQHNFQKETNNYYMIGTFDFNSVMLYSPYAFAINPSVPTITKKDGSIYNANRTGLSDMDRRFINTFYLPFKARQDVCIELDDIVYDSNNNPLSESQRIQLEQQLNMNRCSYPLQ
ncbi:hypothetical protein FO675_01500 [Riemerella anatipestifer]|uniref:M12 family metallopeptidase n=1 Tax=Riemerella anatipestifer TaxID=34085 RepID=UPI001AD712E0|nr:M12 family metallopeptidase [Riemerella anatipestifer]MBO4232989.1 hypothetical protein [Riemerella anatipestifer]MDY3362776.1 M12 family metallopeptidase [Riemerella anatipestifer]MDY3526037.1 M12 family metallopeptidase [Riemerella anatipestifer]